MRLAVGGRQSAGIDKDALALAAGENSCGNLSPFFRKLAGIFNGAGAIIRRERRCGRRKVPNSSILLFSRHRQKLGILRLMRSQGQTIVDSRTQGIFVNPVCRDARGTPLNRGSNGDHQSLLGDILVNGVVRKARESLNGLVDVHFRFRNATLFRQPQNPGANLVQFPLRT